MADELISREAVLKKLSRMIDYCKTDNKVTGLTALFQVADAIMDCPSVNAVVLPCKVGDTVWLTYDDGTDEGVYKVRVQGISVSVTGDDVVLHFGGYPVINAWGSEIGKTVFLTREEAEKALGERKEKCLTQEKS